MPDNTSGASHLFFGVRILFSFMLFCLFWFLPMLLLWVVETGAVGDGFLGLSSVVFWMSIPIVGLIINYSAANTSNKLYYCLLSCLTNSSCPKFSICDFPFFIATIYKINKRNIYLHIFILRTMRFKQKVRR